MRRFLLLLVALLASSPRGLAADAPGPSDDDLAKAVGRFLDAKGPAAREAASAAIVAAKADPSRVAVLLAAGRPFAKDVPTGWQKRTFTGADGVERAWLLFVPKGYDPAKRYPLWIDLHGGVSRPVALSHEELEQMKFFWGEEAEARDLLLAIPAGQSGAEWWTENGAGNVLGILAAVKREYAVDTNRVVATGFSDGGSGSYYLALVHPTPFAAFIPLNGHVGVAGAAGLQIHLRNLVNTPIYAVNTDQDSLYPSGALAPIAEAVKALGAPYVWREIRGYAHDPSYLPVERERIRAWVSAQARVPHPERVVWEGAADAPSPRVHWLADVRVAPRGESSTFPDVNPALPPGRVRLGITLEPEFAGPGVLVKAVGEGSPAAVAGVVPEDVLVAVDGTDVADARVLRTVLAGKTHGSAFRLRLRRGTETVEKEGRFPDAGPEPAFARRGPFGTVDVRRTGNTFEATCANVATFEVLVGVGTVDLAQPVVVRVNGAEAFRGTMVPDLSVLLERAKEDDDPALLYLARIPVRVPGPPPPGK